VAATVYLTEPEFLSYLPGDLQGNSDLTQRQAALDRAASKADGYMAAGGYVTPVDPADVTKAMIGAVADMARYHLASVLRLVPEPVSSSTLYTDHGDAVEWFKGVSRGTIVVNATPVDTGSTPGEASIYTDTSREWRGGW